MHGRPAPLIGDHFANLFAHYRPAGDPAWFKEEKTFDGAPARCLDFHPECAARRAECATPMGNIYI